MVVVQLAEALSHLGLVNRQRLHKFELGCGFRDTSVSISITAIKEYGTKTFYYLTRIHKNKNNIRRYLPEYEYTE